MNRQYTSDQVPLTSLIAVGARLQEAFDEIEALQVKLQETKKLYESANTQARVFARAADREKDRADSLEDAPTIEPVKRGKWTHELGEDFRTCSNCKISMGMDFYEILERFNFCPHCGAKMEQEG